MDFVQNIFAPSYHTQVLDIQFTHLNPKLTAYIVKKLSKRLNPNYYMEWTAKSFKICIITSIIQISSKDTFVC